MVTHDDPRGDAACRTVEQRPEEPTMNIVLVHGSYMGPWCWDLVRPQLERHGHQVTAVDLPIVDPAGDSRAYADAIVAAVDWTEPPVLVGHSMSGLVTPLVAADHPVRSLIFLAAFLAQPGASAMDQRKAEPIDSPIPLEVTEFSDLGDNVWTIGAGTARALFWHEATPEMASWAHARLRPQAYRVMTEMSPLVAWPESTRVASIVCRADRAINPDWVRTAARKRLGVEAVDIDGDHSPMLSRPDELADLLDRLARTTGS
jgi:pimeloyl-ACP methyl ester carboxylesterase